MKLAIAILGLIACVQAELTPARFMESRLTGDCIRSCTGKPDGDYQSCLGCKIFATCANGLLFDERPCPQAGTVWDDRVKECRWASSTCSEGPPRPTGPSCILTCQGKPDGDYQSCTGCMHYASCANGVMFDKRPCALINTYWDDIEKECIYQSTTCREP